MLGQTPFVTRRPKLLRINNAIIFCKITKWYDFAESTAIQVCVCVYEFLHPNCHKSSIHISNIFPFLRRESSHEENSLKCIVDYIKDWIVQKQWLQKLNWWQTLLGIPICFRFEILFWMISKLDYLFSIIEGERISCIQSIVQFYV